MNMHTHTHTHPTYNASHIHTYIHRWYCNSEEIVDYFLFKVLAPLHSHQQQQQQEQQVGEISENHKAILQHIRDLMLGAQQQVHKGSTDGPAVATSTRLSVANRYRLLHVLSRLPHSLQNMKVCIPPLFPFFSSSLLTPLLSSLLSSLHFPLFYFFLGCS